MKLMILQFAVMLLLSNSVTSDETSPIVLPINPVLVEPSPQPKPIDPTAPTVISEVKQNEMYVVESSVKLLTLTSPQNVLLCEEAEGPIKVRSRFSDGNGSFETRTYSSKFIYFFTASDTGGKTELILIPVGVSVETDIVRQLLTVQGLRPNPPPDPVDPVTPDPVVPDPVDPIVTPSKIKVVVIEDTTSRTQAQINILDGYVLRDYVRSHCSVTDGEPDFRKLSVLQDVSKEPDWIKTAFAEPRSSLPFIVVSNGTSGAALPLPSTLEETMTLLKKYGGE